MDTLFTPEYKVLNELFGRDTKYIIPEYQRPYSWDCVGKSDKNNQVNVMWDDLISYFDDKNPNPYFLGSMVLVGNSSSQEYQVIDGQQRLTTLTILFVAIKCFLFKSKDKIHHDKNQEISDYISLAISLIDDIVFNKKIFGASIQEKKVRIEKITGFDYDNVLKIAMECGDIKNINFANATEEQAIVSKRYFDNRKFFETKLSEAFLTNNQFSYNDAGKLNEFIEFLKQKVAVVRILASRFDVAYQIFEILNNRGLPLSNKDLFRNFVIKEFHALKATNVEKYADLDPNKKWNELEENYDLENEFISRWVESRKATNQQYSAFNDLKELFENHYKKGLNKAKIEIFIDDLKEDLANYTKITNFEVADKVINSKLQVILNSGNTTYSINLLLSLFRHCKYDDNNIQSKVLILEFINIYETYILYLLLGSSKRFSSKPIYDAIKALNDNRFEDAKKDFLLEKEEIENLKELIQKPIKDNTIAKLFISKFFWIIDNEIDDDVIDNMKLNFQNSTLEHIMPQNPDDNTNWFDFDINFRKEMTYKLGNMTLLTKKKNSSAKNFSFDKKKIQYKQTKLMITHAISERDNLDEEFFKRRHKEIVIKILNDLKIDTHNIL